MKSNNKLPEIGERYYCSGSGGYYINVTSIDVDDETIFYSYNWGNSTIRETWIRTKDFWSTFEPLPKEQEEDIQEEINLAYDIAYDKGYKDAQNTYDVAKMCVAKEDVKRLLKDYDFDWEVEGIQFRSMLEGLMMAAQNLIIELDHIVETNKKVEEAKAFELLIKGE